MKEVKLEALSVPNVSSPPSCILFFQKWKECTEKSVFVCVSMYKNNNHSLKKKKNNNQICLVSHDGVCVSNPLHFANSVKLAALPRYLTVLRYLEY